MPGRGDARVSPQVELVVTHLEMTSRDALRPGGTVPEGVRLALVPHSQAGAAAREGYLQVGAPWHWTDRLHLDDGEWQAIVEEEQGEVWQARDDAGLVGYFQLAARGGEVAICYFGLVERCIGRGIGGWMLTRAVERCWSLGARRVTLNTCTLDGPAALPNYLRRGFTIVREERRTKEIA